MRRPQQECHVALRGTGFTPTLPPSAKSIQIVARITGGLAFAATSDDLTRQGVTLLVGSLVDVIPYFGHEIARFMGGAVVRFHNLAPLSEVDFQGSILLCPTSMLCLMACLLPVASSAILPIATATTTTPLLLSSRSLRAAAAVYATALGLRARDLRVLDRSGDGVE